MSEQLTICKLIHLLEGLPRDHLVYVEQTDDDGKEPAHDVENGRGFVVITGNPFR